jgi:hypothetical protein
MGVGRDMPDPVGEVRPAGADGAWTGAEAGGPMAGSPTTPRQCGQETCCPPKDVSTWNNPEQWGQENCIGAIHHTSHRQLSDPVYPKCSAAPVPEVVAPVLWVGLPTGTPWVGWFSTPKWTRQDGRQVEYEYRNAEYEDEHE